MSAALLRGAKRLCDACATYNDPVIRDGWLTVQLCVSCAKYFGEAAAEANGETLARVVVGPPLQFTAHGAFDDLDKDGDT